VNWSDDETGVIGTCPVTTNRTTGYAEHPLSHHKTTEKEVTPIAGHEVVTKPCQVAIKAGIEACKICAKIAAGMARLASGK
jgi:hypothetical protein